MMKISNLPISFIFVALLGLTNLPGLAHSQNTSPVVVELYTSQGCESCPPAEAFLKELSQRDGVIALEFHIDYWDYIGWADPFADPNYTQRQKNYAAVMESRYVYTPQMIFNGVTHEVGSKKTNVNSVISKLQETSAPPTPQITLSAIDNGIELAIAPLADLQGSYDVILVGFDGEHVTEVTRGENRGEKLVNTNVVRSLTQIATWNGEALHTTAPVQAGNGGCAVLLQNTETLEIISAATISF